MNRDEWIRIPPKRRGLPLRYEFDHPAKSYRWLLLIVLLIAIAIARLVMR
jgi:hypothetical protein